MFVLEIYLRVLFYYAYTPICIVQFSKFRAKLYSRMSFMSNNFFRFKQFIVYQDLCAMKVGTDGVLLGAWVNVSDCNNVLDIGTGTGLVAMMMAQRNPKAKVDALDIYEGCVMQAQQNVSNSPFAQHIDVQHNSFQAFALHTHKKYDLIVSNPPYFQNALKSPDLSRTQARHNDSLSFFDILSAGAPLLLEGGRIALILPHEFKQMALDHAGTVDLFANRITNVFALPHKPAKRLLIEFGASEMKCVEDDLIIELGRHQYSDEFNALTAEYYLDR